MRLSVSSNRKTPKECRQRGATPNEAPPFGNPRHGKGLCPLIPISCIALKKLLTQRKNFYSPFFAPCFLGQKRRFRARNSAHSLPARALGRVGMAWGFLRGYPPWAALLWSVSSAVGRKDTKRRNRLRSAERRKMIFICLNFLETEPKQKSSAEALLFLF